MMTVTEDSDKLKKYLNTQTEIELQHQAFVDERNEIMKLLK